jgi:hypothetical protein
VKVMICNNSVSDEGDFRTRWAFQTLVDGGNINSFRLIPFGEAGSEMRRNFVRDVVGEVADYRPDVLIWHKDDGRDLSADLVRSLASKTRLLYHDLDPWMRWIKPVQPNQRLLAKNARLVYLCGLGSIAQQFTEASKRIRYSPHGYYDIDIPAKGRDKTPKMVFIGSIHRRAKRLLRRFAPEQHPGRTRAVRVLRERLGHRFDVYGNGYPAAWNIRPCAFHDQFDLIDRYLASFAIDAAPGAPLYFSNRTPFSLACGSIHFKIRRPGDEDQFADCPGLIPAENAEDAAATFQDLLSWAPQRLCQIADATSEFARIHLRHPDLYFRMLSEAMATPREAI